MNVFQKEIAKEFDEIPIFPIFRELRESDRDVINKFIEKYPPYSDYNFVSLWSWNIKEQFRISQLNKNLVIRFTDYITGEPFYSFLGVKEVNDTVEQLFALMRREGIDLKLKLIPEVSYSKLENKGHYYIEEDPDNYDYVLSLERLKEQEEGKLSTRRRMIKKFKEEFKPHLQKLDLSNPANQQQILSVCKQWEMQKGLDPDEATHVFEALRRLLMNGFLSKICGFGVYVQDRLVGYSINEILNDQYALGHFMQCDLHTSTAIYAYLMQETAPHFIESGCRQINIEQDLGIPGLRKWKESYKSHIFLKKFIIRPQLPSYS